MAPYLDPAEAYEAAVVPQSVYDNAMSGDSIEYSNVEWREKLWIDGSKCMIRVCIGTNFSDPECKMRDNEGFSAWAERIRPKSEAVDTIITSETIAMYVGRGGVSVYKGLYQLDSRFSLGPREVKIQSMALKKVSETSFEVVRMVVGDYGN